MILYPAGKLSAGFSTPLGTEANITQAVKMRGFV